MIVTFAVTSLATLDVSVTSNSPVATGLNVYVPFSFFVSAAASPFVSAATNAGSQPAETTELIRSD